MFLPEWRIPYSEVLTRSGRFFFMITREVNAVSKNFEAIGPIFTIKEVHNEISRYQQFIVSSCNHCGGIVCISRKKFKAANSCGCLYTDWRKRKTMKYTEADIDVMEKLRSEGKNSSEISRVVGCSHHTVIDNLAKRGIAFSRSCVAEKNPRWSGHQMISKTYWNIIETGAASRDLEFEIDIEEMWEIYEKQGRMCAISGVDIILSKKARPEKGEQTASIDRIDSSKGYTLDNVQWVHKAVNRMKMDMTESEFITWCKIISAKSIYG